jgi:DNA-binding protein HU-beta
MNKGELISAVALANTGMKLAEAKTVVESVMSVVATTLRNGDEVTLPGVGKLKVKTKPGRAGRNPATGAAITIPAKRVVKFSPASEFSTAFSPVPTAPAA